MITCVTLVFVYYSEIADRFDDLADWIRDNKVLGPVVLAISFAIVTPLMFPGGFINIGTGFVMSRVFEEKWKAILVGSLTAFFGEWIGSCISFVCGRYLLRDLARRLKNRFKIMNALDVVIKTEGFKTCLLLRLCPLVPFNALNYVLGGTSISFMTYFLSSIGICT